MAVTAKRLVSGSQLTTGAATYYTAATSTKGVIKSAVLTNTSANTVTATMHLVPSAGTADATNQIISAKAIAAGESYTCPEAVNQVLEAGGTIQALASSGAAITLVVSGAEIT